MSSFGWARFLGAHGIPYVTKGPNTARGHLSIRCPWCGDNDPSQHLGISLRGEGWGCLRDSQHRGRSRARLIAALLHCSLQEAHQLAETDHPSPTPLDEDFRAQVAFLLDGEPIQSVVKGPLVFPPQVKPLTTNKSALPFWAYLLDPIGAGGRGYRLKDVEWLVENYKFHYALRGEHRYRLIVPIHSRSGALQTWTGRTIIKTEKVRYRSLPKEQSLDVPSNLLLGLPLLWNCPNPNLLVVCEGPFDALRMSALGYAKGVYGTCLFGLVASNAQSVLLDQLSQRFRRMVLLLDPDAYWAVLRIRDSLLPLRVEIGTLPANVKDPGDLSREQALELMEMWLDI